MVAAVARQKSSPEHDEFLSGGAPFAGKYAVERILGVGGMGTVFEARHIRLGHRVAIKVLGSELRDYPELVTRFEREARAAGSLTSRHAVRVFDIDMTEDATPFIVMELLAGEDLARIIERDGEQPVPRAVRWVIEACDAIAEAHRLGIIHRDLKPSNLFLTAEGVKVLDFGIAKRVAAKEASITHAVAPLGTPQYMSPEQVRCAKDVDARTDVWSLGVTLFELLTARTPFAHEIPQACIASIAADPVPDPRTFRADLPPELAAVLMKALAKDPSQRWASVADLVQALAPFAAVDDEDPSTAVSRVIASATRARRCDASTLDGGLDGGLDGIDGLDDGAARRSTPPAAQSASTSSNDVFESGVRPSLRPPSMRAPMESEPEPSVPPTVTKIPMPTRSRLRSSLALASAAVLGLAALIITPRWVSHVDSAAPATAAARANTPAVTAAPSMKIEPVAVAPSMAIEINEDQPTTATIAMTPTAASAVAVVKKPAAAATVRPAATSTSSAKPAARQDTTPRRYYGDSPVHGGLSSPGF